VVWVRHIIVASKNKFLSTCPFLAISRNAFSGCWCFNPALRIKCIFSRLLETPSASLNLITFHKWSIEMVLGKAVLKIGASVLPYTRGMHVLFSVSLVNAWMHINVRIYGPTICRWGYIHAWSIQRNWHVVL
jgi:hypothetical protein